IYPCPFRGVRDRANLMFSRQPFRTVLVLASAASLSAAGADAPKSQKPSSTPLAPIDTSGFRDSSHHWRHIKEPERVMQPLPDQPAYEPAQVREITANILLFQRDNGGW